MSLRLLLVAAIVSGTKACVASGICGGLGASPCFSPIPPVAPACAGGIGCSPGYTCGSYGCYRSRARVHSAGTLQAQGPILMGADRFSQFRRQEIPKDPNAMFMQCCEQRGLPDACLHKCTFNTYTKDSVRLNIFHNIVLNEPRTLYIKSQIHRCIYFQLTRMYFKQDACPIAASAEIQFCAAQGRDHRACCARNGVATTLAGHKV
uniref:DB domain-containing protein n=1 Tax=Heterorhabditis bacteriophora TaxID=37862 RepID=A0A1I7XTG3_HETBA